jgi:hypothetical protein
MAACTGMVFSREMIRLSGFYSPRFSACWSQELSIHQKVQDYYTLFELPSTPYYSRHDTS